MRGVHASSTAAVDAFTHPRISSEMGKAGSDGGLLPMHTSHGQQLQKLAFMGFLSLLLAVNLMYFVKTHTRIESLAASAGRWLHAKGCHQSCYTQ